MEKAFEGSRRFYEEDVRGMIRELFPKYEKRIAVGLVGEGSDCFGYDDVLSKDHDYGTGVCLWITEEDFAKIGSPLSIAYNELLDKKGIVLSERLRARRGVMAINDFYGNILGAPCDAESGNLSDDDWLRYDKTCLATAVNGEVFRDDLGIFSAFRKVLLAYYPDRPWRVRIAEEMHAYSAALQVNYARCMVRRDIVAADLCRLRGMEAAMQLFFLLKRIPAPYYKWTYHALREIRGGERLAPLLEMLSKSRTDVGAWKSWNYDTDRLNLNDATVLLSERIAAILLELLRENGLSRGMDPYLERYVNEVLDGRRTIP
ncbi:MAG: DUF4037 domain-containing protein [Lachnospiraceae bacterium]|jgi:hypothetical protein|nr:DUF4037 domain-containing protein [Lachnospiraceae bacterium]